MSSGWLVGDVVGVEGAVGELASSGSCDECPIVYSVNYLSLL